MKKSLKGALLSGLVFPGVGQLWLKCYLRGAALIVLVFASTAVIVKNAVQQALSILDHIEAEGGAIDIDAMVKSANHASENGFVKSASAMLAVCWIVGIVDAYLAGRKKDMAARSNDPKRRNPSLPNCH